MIEPANVGDADRRFWLLMQAREDGLGLEDALRAAAAAEAFIRDGSAPAPPLLEDRRAPPTGAEPQGSPPRADAQVVRAVRAIAARGDRITVKAILSEVDLAKSTVANVVTGLRSAGTLVRVGRGPGSHYRLADSAHLTPAQTAVLAAARQLRDADPAVAETGLSVADLRETVGRPHEEVKSALRDLTDMGVLEACGATTARRWFLPGGDAA